MPLDNLPPISTADATYSQFAPIYDLYKSVDDYGRAAELILEIAALDGCRPVDVLDAATGTGNLAEQFARHGMSVWAFDYCDEMLDVARKKPSLSRATIFNADMRHLPIFAESFDLVTCWNDSMNYLLTLHDFRQAIQGFYARMRSGAVLVFDLNTLNTYRAIAEGAVVYETAAGSFTLRPKYNEIQAGRLFQYTLGQEYGTGMWRGDTEHNSIHTQRHYRVSEVTRVLKDAGFTRVQKRGIRSRNLFRADGEQDFRKIVYSALRLP
ncbi:hypothetical protein GCM10009785_07770 [Brooklawnia cerclae]|uniref:SAM-dependent methyltransferase n=1 Tax=Brooklawnia cerclae TaxID=349934 RepID=A0ABX0SNL2_9ACTN|nr:class I SAM-dependent methyltransferase [Brooklawnia cerclae]NIH58356.1 SAM-dependent methyltransferase [Brooklawnia cerclae]